MNTTEPFGLPTGTVRGVLTLMFTGVTLYLFGSGQAVDPALLGITTLIIGNYFGTRGQSAAAEPPVQMDAPYIPGAPTE